MTKLSREDILKLARLARLRLSDDEVLKYQAELSEIIDYVALLDNADTAGLNPTYQVTSLTNVTRADAVIDYGATPEELLKNAPDTKNGLIKVRRMIV